MIARLETVHNYIESIRELMQFHCKAIQICNNVDVAPELEFKTALVKLLQLQCKLYMQKTLIELCITPTTTRALHIIGARYVVREGQVLISE